MCVDFCVWYIIPNEVSLNSLMAGDNKKFTHQAIQRSYKKVPLLCSSRFNTLKRKYTFPQMEGKIIDIGISITRFTVFQDFFSLVFQVARIQLMIFEQIVQKKPSSKKDGALSSLNSKLIDISTVCSLNFNPYLANI